MRTNPRLPTLSFLMIALVAAACGTTETFLPFDTSVDTSADASDTDSDVDTGTVPSDTDIDTRGDADTTGPRECVDPDPSVTCQEAGCPVGEECVPDAMGCTPSECYCSEGIWSCTADCGEAFICRPNEACPDVEPFGESCTEIGLTCGWGTECCCGECYNATECTCTETGWACYATDACLIESCEGRPCSSDSDCASWGGDELACVSGVCTDVPDPDGWREGPDIDIVIGCDIEASDPFELGSAELVDGGLSVLVSYGGGCEVHRFRACWDGSFMESWPVQVSLSLQHDGNDDPCDAYLSEELLISLDTLRSAYEEAYAASTGAIVIHFGFGSFHWEF